MQEKAARSTAIFGTCLGAVAVSLHLALTLESAHARGGPALVALWHFLGFFTNLSNIFAALVLAHAALRPKLRTGLAAPRVEAAATVSVVMAGFLNSVLLARHFHQEGLFKLTDFALHEAAPFTVALFWLLRPHGELRARDALLALSWPLLYCVYALMRGAADGWYPYYFLDPALLGATGLAANILALGSAFFGATLILLAVDHILGKGLPRRSLFENAASRTGL
jgi:hypothetical protein